MKRIFLVATVLLIMAGTTGCRGRRGAAANEGEAAVETIQGLTESAVDMHNAHNSLDVDGLYRSSEFTMNGFLVWEGIILDGDSYERAYFPAGEKVQESLRQEAGTVSWIDAGNTITLDSAIEPNGYFVGENKLIPLDRKGRKVESPERVLMKVEE